MRGIETPRSAREARKRLVRTLEELRHSTILVEGQRDRRALARLGCRTVYTVSGRVRAVCAQLAQDPHPIAVLTDMDRRGNELLEQTCEELERYGIRCRRDLRKRLARMLRIKYFEDAERAYDKYVEELEKIGG